MKLTLLAPPFVIITALASSLWATPPKEPLEAFVSTEKAFMWTKPGYSWSDCRPLEQEQPGNQFKSPDDESITMQRFSSGAKEVCLARDKKKDLLSAGDAVEIERGENGKVIKETHEILIGGELMKKNFYLVNFKGRTGWMSEDQITEPALKEFPKPEPEKPNPYCPPASKTANQLKGLALKIPELQKSVDRNLGLAHPKSDQEIDRYMCLYHDGRIQDDHFPSLFKQFQKSAKQASQSFGIPYGLIMCTMLVESGLYYDPQEKKEYKGLPQFGSAFVADLRKIKQRSPYNQMWENYQKLNPSLELTDSAVRSSADPAAPAAAIALAYQWIYWDRIQQISCRDCSLNHQINRKELYMLVTGYNWGPYALSKVAGKSAAQMRFTPPPPKESRDYMGRMENCMASGYDQSFREEGQRRKPAAQKKQANNKKKTPTRQTLSGERALYQVRVEQCDQLFPVK